MKRTRLKPKPEPAITVRLNLRPTAERSPGWDQLWRWLLEPTPDPAKAEASQHPENHLPDLRAWAERRGVEVVAVYQVQESAWRGAHQKALNQVYQDARRGRFQVLLVWAPDRLSREGIAVTLEIIERLGRYRVKVLSLQESWTEVEGPMQELLLSIVAWVATMESNRRSERTKTGLARAVSEGKRLGRPAGSKDKKKRSRRGYFARWAK